MTAKYKSEFLRVCEERGFIHQITDAAALDKYLENGGGIGYIGFDCTAKSLHVGSLIQIMLLRWFQKTGNKPIVLMGGGTTKVGDPSGKDESRQLLTDEQINVNMESLKGVFAKFIEFGSSGTQAVMVNNDEWLSKLNYIAFLRDYGRHLSVNEMMKRDSVKLRLEREQHLSFLEFNYMVLQAYDFVELTRRHKCRLQIGGSDQWGNIVGGVELHRKTFWYNHTGKLSKYVSEKDQKEFDESINHIKTTLEANADNPQDYFNSLPTETQVNFAVLKDLLGKDLRTQNIYQNLEIFGMTSPLITTASGAKMGKTANGAIWLNADMCTPYDYWQYFRNTEDADVGRFLRMFTELEISEIEKLEKLKDAEINEAKKILATEATKLCHGKEAAETALETARKTFEEGTIGDNLPSINMPYEIIITGTAKVVECFTSSGLTKSNSEARTLIGQGAAKINDQKISDQTYALKESDFVNGVAKLSAGKKKHALVKLTQ